MVYRSPNCAAVFAALLEENQRLVVVTGGATPEAVVHHRVAPDQHQFDPFLPLLAADIFLELVKRLSPQRQAGVTLPESSPDHLISRQPSGTTSHQLHRIGGLARSRKTAHQHPVLNRCVTQPGCTACSGPTAAYRPGEPMWSEHWFVQQCARLGCRAAGHGSPARAGAGQRAQSGPASTTVGDSANHPRSHTCCGDWVRASSTRHRPLHLGIPDRPKRMCSTHRPGR